MDTIFLIIFLLCIFINILLSLYVMSELSYKREELFKHYGGFKSVLIPVLQIPFIYEFILLMRYRTEVKEKNILYVCNILFALYIIMHISLLSYIFLT